MYIPERYKPPSLAAMLAVIQQHPLATLTRFTNGALVADHLPLVLDNTRTKLQGHVALANPLAREDATDVLVVFHGAESYMSPSWCESKKHDPALVPTWNYVVVHINGQLCLKPDKAWLLKHLKSLTQQAETAVGQSWQLTDAPEDYLNRLSSVIVGIEIDIEQLFGKWKTSIVKPENNVNSVASGLRSLGLSGGNAMADWVEQRYKL